MAQCHKSKPIQPVEIIDLGSLRPGPGLPSPTSSPAPATPTQPASEIPKQESKIKNPPPNPPQFLRSQILKPLHPQSRNLNLFPPQNLSPFLNLNPNPLPHLNIRSKSAPQRKKSPFHPPIRKAKRPPKSRVSPPAPASPILKIASHPKSQPNQVGAEETVQATLADPTALLTISPGIAP